MIYHSTRSLENGVNAREALLKESVRNFVSMG